MLNGTDLRLELGTIPASLSPRVDVGSAAALPCNQTPKRCFQGQTLGVTSGFTLDAEARDKLVLRAPAEVTYIHPFLSGQDLLHKLEPDRWVIDLPHQDALTVQRDAPVLLDHLRREVLPVRKKAAMKEAADNAELLAANPNSRSRRHHAGFLDYWWTHAYRRGEMLDAIKPLDRYIATARVSSGERRPIFTFLESSIRPSDKIVVIALDDDYSLGVLQSALHQAWFEARCVRLKADVNYNSRTVWDSFPWPQAPTRRQINDIGDIVRQLLAVRTANLRAGISLARQYDSLREPGKSRLRDLHEQLDEAVIAAYGFTTDQDYLAQLLALNLDLAADPGQARGPGYAKCSGRQ